MDVEYSTDDLKTSIDTSKKLFTDCKDYIVYSRKRMSCQPEEFSVQKRQCTSMETVDHNKQQQKASLPVELDAPVEVAATDTADTLLTDTVISTGEMDIEMAPQGRDIADHPNPSDESAAATLVGQQQPPSPQQPADFSNIHRILRKPHWDEFSYAPYHSDYY